MTAVRTGSSPAIEIRGYAKAEDIDIILMGTHGRGVMGHLLMGSVAEKVVRIAPCPVLTVTIPNTSSSNRTRSWRPAQGSSDAGTAMPTIPAPTSRLVLRDGSTAGVRPATASDRDAMRRFFDELSPASRRLRFLAATTASDELLDRFCENSEPEKLSRYV